MYFDCLLWPSSLSPTLVEVCMTYVNICKALDLKFSLICSAYFWGSYIESTPTWGCFHARFSTSDQWFFKKRVLKRFLSISVVWITGSTSLYWPICRVFKLRLGLEKQLWREDFVITDNVISTCNKFFTVLAQFLNK